MDNVLIYSEGLASTEYSPTHPFKPVRARQMLDLLHRHSLIFEKNQRIEPAIPLTDEEITSFHDPEYIRMLRICDRGEFDVRYLHYGLGTSDNPIFSGIFTFAAASSGGTLRGARILLDGGTRVAFNPIGGYHHAMQDHASGFCYINDIVIAIKELLRAGLRVAYIDIDAHHGDGVQAAFFDDQRVLKISIHESGQSLFPGSGYENEIGFGNSAGYTLNIPLLQDSDDETYRLAFDAVVPEALDLFSPDVVCLQVGGDAHREDPLAHLNLTSGGYEHVLKCVNERSSRILVTGGGGYNLFKTASLWALAWAVLCGIEPHDHFAGSVGGMMFGPEASAGSLRDEPFTLKGHKKDVCVEHAQGVAAYLKKFALPRLRASGGAGGSR